MYVLPDSVIVFEMVGAAYGTNRLCDADAALCFPYAFVNPTTAMVSGATVFEYVTMTRNVLVVPTVLRIDWVKLAPDGSGVKSDFKTVRLSTR